MQQAGLQPDAAASHDPGTQLRLGYLHLLTGESARTLELAHEVKYGRVSARPDLEEAAHVLLAMAYSARGDHQRARHFANEVLGHGRNSLAMAEARRVLQAHAGAPPTPVAATAPRAGAPALAILPRSSWSKRGILADRLDPMAAGIRKITVHHGGFDADSSELGAAKRVLQSIQRTHVESEGYGDIGYHYAIDDAGRVWECRSTRYQGAHAGDGNANRANLGICLLGNFQNQPPSARQRQSLRSLVGYLLGRHGLDARALVTHREVRPAHLGATVCPGDHLQSLVDRMRSELDRTARAGSDE